MRKTIVFALFTLISFVSLAQERQIQIRSSALIKGFQTEGYVRIIKPVFAQEGSTLAADSADYNQSANTFNAFGNIVITQPSGTTIYSDLLNYDGNTRLAILTNKVRLVDGDATLTTDYLTYNMNTRIGTYKNGGKIVNAENVLTSRTGYYFATTRDAYFRYNVVLNSPDALIKTDTLRYNSNSKIAYFYGPTNIYGKDDTLYTENGTYNTTNDQARFGKRNLYTQGSKSLKGDSLFYDRKAGYGRAIGNIIFIDTAEKAMLRGGIGLYRKSDESILVTKNPYVVISSESDSAKVDSIWMTADTLFSKVVFTRDIKPYKQLEIQPDTAVAAISTGSDLPPSSDSALIPEAPVDSAAVAEVPADSVVLKNAAAERQSKAAVRRQDRQNAIKTISAKTDTSTVSLSKASPRVPPDSIQQDTSRTRIIMAYRQAKIFKSDLQARADSIFFSYSDSTARCFINPMVWSQGSQLSGDTVFLQMKNKKLDNMLLKNNSFIVNTDDADSTNFNQIKGKVITGFFKDSKLNRMFVDGNAESVYYVKDDTVYTGLNHLISSRLKILLNDSKLKSITAIRSIEASVTPMEDLKEEDRILKGFIWKPRDRPKSKEEIIPELAAGPVKGAAAESGKKPAPKPAKAPAQKPEVKGPARSVKPRISES